MNNQRDAAAQEATGGAGTTNGNGDQQQEATSVEQLRARLDEEKARAEGYLAQWQRAAADFQNFKRRTEQEREEYGRFASTAFIVNILPAVDDLDRALANVDESLASSSWVEGIRAIQRKLKGALEASGVSEIAAAGERFDPNIHEAISQAPGAHDAVVAEVQKGYRLGNRVIRPAMVVVGNGDES
jgi:molecular chaperone GrpE